MSAFFVDDTCLTKCVTAMLIYATEIKTKDGDILTHNGTGKTTPIPHGERLSGDKIGRALRAMNAEALRQRYNDEFAPDDLGYTFTHYEAEREPAVLLKALHCLSYQCSEGNVPETDPLYQEIDRVCDLLQAAEGVIETNSRAYQAAPWGD